MLSFLLVVFFSIPAAATPAVPATLEALRSEAVRDPAGAENAEAAAARAGKSFDQNFTVEALAPVEHIPLDGKPRSAPPRLNDKPAPRKAGAGADYYFEGSSPLEGITIYTPKAGDGSTGGDNAPAATAKYAKYGKMAMAAGLALGLTGLIVAGPYLAPLVFAAGLLIGVGALLAFLFRKKK